MPQDPRAVRAKRRRLHKREAARWRKVLQVVRALDPNYVFIRLKQVSLLDVDHEKWTKEMSASMGIPKEYLLGDHSSGVSQEMESFEKRLKQESDQLQRRLNASVVAIMQEARKKGATPSS